MELRLKTWSMCNSALSGQNMLTVLEIYDTAWLIPAGLRAADVKTPQSILIVVVRFPQHPSHSNIVLRSALARQASEIPYGDPDTAGDLGAVGVFSVQLVLLFKALLPYELCYGGHE